MITTGTIWSSKMIKLIMDLYLIINIDNGLLTMDWARQAIDSAVRVLKEGGMGAIKLKVGPHQVSLPWLWSWTPALWWWAMWGSPLKELVCLVSSGLKGRMFQVRSRYAYWNFIDTLVVVVETLFCFVVKEGCEGLSNSTYSYFIISIFRTMSSLCTCACHRHGMCYLGVFVCLHSFLN